jgi:trigger factor
VNINGVKRNLVVEIPAEQVEHEIESLARKLALRVRVPGFRPGKVPLSVVRQRYAADLRDEATHEIVQRFWKETIAAHQIRPLAEPVVEGLKHEPGFPLSFTLAFEVLPEFEVKDYGGVPITMDSSAVEETAVDAAIESLREQQAQYIPVENGEASDGNMVSVTVDGIPDGGGRPIHEDDISFVIGDPETHESFSENLRGVKGGETRSFDVTYPEDHHRKRLAGKLVHYSVKVKDIKEKQLVELNDDFAKDLGAESLARLRERVRDELITKATRAAEKKAREAVIDEVVRRNTFDVPDCLVEEELQNHARRIASSLARQGIDVNKTSLDWKKIFAEQRPAAEQSVRRSIVLDAIARKEEIEVTDEDLNREFETLAAGSGKSAAAVRAQFDKDNRIPSFKEHLRQNKALDFTFRNATISRG